MSRRKIITGAGGSSLAALVGGLFRSRAARADAAAPAGQKKGAQRLSLEKLGQWEALRYGMFIHFGMSTFAGNEYTDGQVPLSTYTPDRLDVDQWVSVARDAGMKYIVLTAKHVAGHCLWPSKYTDYTVANSPNTTDVVGQFVEACRKRGVLPGFYYCSWDNHNRFGSYTPSDPNSGVFIDEADFACLKNGQPVCVENGKTKHYSYTTSLYQTFQTAQLTELLTRYGPIAEIWIDIPGVLGRGYRTFLYNHIDALSPETVIVTNGGVYEGDPFRVAYAWPTDIITIEKRLPPEPAHKKWRTIEGKDYCMPGEVCDTIGERWFYFEDDPPQPDDKLVAMFNACRQRGVNLLLNVPPDKHGVIPDGHVQSLMRLRKNVGL